jgi:hypothetical protein
MLDKYLQMYFDQLIEKIKILSEHNILVSEIEKLISTPDIKTFILNADIASQIHYIYDNLNINHSSVTKTISILKNEIDLFVQ